MEYIKGSGLIIISRIKRDGSGTEPVDADHRKLIRDESFKMSCLSISKGTFIASGFNSYVVKLKARTKKGLNKSTNQRRYDV